MFSGIVEELGRVVANRIDSDGRLDVGAAHVLEGVRIGDSIAVNGCCLTVVDTAAAGFSADIMPETAGRTNLGALAGGDRVNLEASLRLGDRIGGHLVSGHVDAVGRVLEVRDDANARWVTVGAPVDVAGLVVPKGSVAVDGISLTVVDALPGAFTVSLIPHTLEVTTAGSWRAGSLVNLEADMLARHVAKAVAQLTAREPR